MNAQELSADAQISPAIDYTATGTTTLTGTVDMQGFDGVMFVAVMVTANAANYLKAGGGAASDGSDASDLAGSKVVALASGNLCILDIYKPTQRYITASVVRGGATTILGGCIAIRYHAGNKPRVNTVANDADCVKLISPALGTA